MKMINKYKGDILYKSLNVILLFSIAVSSLLLENGIITGILIVALIIVQWVSAKALANQLKSIAESEELKDFKSLKSLIQSYKSGMNEAAELIESLGKEGDRSFKDLKSDDQLAVAIIAVDQQLKDYNEEERKRNWRVEGLAKFGDILRSHDIEIKELSRQIISNLVQYLGANQGGLFLLKKDEQDEYLELASCFAYEKERIREKRINIGQGLIGQCVIEKSTIYLLDIPDDYVNITSGLGEATPSNVIIVPLMINEKVYGAVEIASFSKIEKYKVEFLEQLAENIASVMASLSNNERTKVLLEDANQLTTELQSREEEMRQNMEELTATQEEMSRNQAELDSVFSAINHTMGVAELDINGYFTSCNDQLKSIFGMSGDDIMGREIWLLTGKEQSASVLAQLSAGEIVSDEFESKRKNGTALWLNVSFSPIKDVSGDTAKILVMATDITERKLEEIEFEKLSLVADNTDNSVVITDNKGCIEYVNHGFCSMTGYTGQEVMGKKPGDFLQGEETDKETVERIRQGIKTGEPIYEEILNYTKAGELYWISMAINPVFDDNGNIDKFISIQANITETKKNALDFRYKLEAIGKSNAIVEMDVNGLILDTNENFLEIVGYEQGELTGKHHKTLVPNEIAASDDYEKFWERLAKGEFVSGEFQRKKKNGDIIWLRGMYNPIFDMNGKPHKIVKFAVDITQEKALKKQAETKEVDLNNHMEAINKTIASVEFGLDGSIRGANKIFTSITGIPEDQLTKLNYLQIIPEGEIDKPQTQLMWENLRTGQFFNGEFKLKDNENKELWLTGTFNPINDMDGNPYKIMMFAQFNTAEKEKQKDLTGTITALKNTAPIMELNADGTFKSANELFFTEFGYKRLELRKRPFIEFLKDKKSQQEMPEIIKKLEGHEFVENDLAFIDSAGNLKHFRTTFTPIFNLEDKLSKIVVIMIDREVVMKL